MKIFLNNVALVMNQYSKATLKKQLMWASSIQDSVRDLVVNLGIDKDDTIEFVFKATSLKKSSLLWNEEVGKTFRIGSDVATSDTSFALNIHFFGYIAIVTVNENNLNKEISISYNKESLTSIVDDKKTTTSMKKDVGVTPVEANTYPFYMLYSSNLALKYLKITSSSKEVKHNIVPAIDVFDTCCLYDTITESLYYSDSGNLITTNS